jgi:hypothetical protein
MRDLSKLLWSELESDEERIEFLESGRAQETGIIASVTVPDVVKAFRYKLAYRNLLRVLTIGSCSRGG